MAEANRVLILQLPAVNNLNFGFISFEIQRDFKSDCKNFFEGYSQCAISEKKFLQDGLKAAED